MYKLTLTREERKAIDWIGDRYSNGNALYSLLWLSDQGDNRNDWDDDCDITFTVPKYIAWEIKENNEKEDAPWPCFEYRLALKMQDFVDQIV